jgi:hypothetical protein
MQRQESHKRVIGKRREQIETRQNHYREITQFLAKLFISPKTDYDQGV